MPRRAETILTDTAICKLRPAERRYEVRDAARPGFGVRVELYGRQEREARSAARQGRPAPGTFADLAVRDARRRRKPRSVHEDERKLRVDVPPRWGARRVGEIRRADVLPDHLAKSRAQPSGQH